MTTALEAFLASAASAATTILEAVDVPMDGFFEALDAETTATTVTDDQYRYLKKFALDLQAQVMSGTYAPTPEQADEDNRTVVAWYRAQRETAFVAIREKPKKEPKPKAPKKKTKKQLAEEALADPNALLDAIF